MHALPLSGWARDAFLYNAAAVRPQPLVCSKSCQSWAVNTAVWTVEVQCSADEGQGRIYPIQLNNLAGSLKMCEYASAHQQASMLQSRETNQKLFFLLVFGRCWEAYWIGRRVMSLKWSVQ